MTELIAGKKISELPELVGDVNLEEVQMPCLDVNRQNRRIRGSTLLGNVPEASPEQKGIVKLAGHLGGTADEPTVPTLQFKADLNSPEFTGKPLVPTAPVNTNDEQAANTRFVMRAISNNRAPDATETIKGVVKLTNDLGGTADAPTVPGLACKAPIESPRFRGTPTVPTPGGNAPDEQVANVAFVNGVAAGILAMLPPTVERICRQIEAPQSKTYTLELSAPYGYRITRFTAVTGTGSADVTLIAGSAFVAEVSDLTVNSTQTTVEVTSRPLVSVGRSLWLQVATTPTPVQDLIVSVELERE